MISLDLNLAVYLALLAILKGISDVLEKRDLRKNVYIHRIHYETSPTL